MPVRFEEILSTATGKDGAFEELTCQLARRSPPEKAVEFRRIHGAGGDGGVEAYWVLNDGGEVGYQAKYYLQSGDVSWDAIDKSVETALKLHPRLRTYYIAIACDLTDKTSRKGKTGWEKWEEHKRSWESLAKRSLGHEVHFVPWSAFELRAMLELPQMAGLLEHWFGELCLRSDWLSYHVDRAVADLDERYHAEDHVPVGVEQLFDVVCRSSKIREHFREGLNQLNQSANRWLVEAPRISPSHAAKARRAFAEVVNVLSLQTEFDAALWIPWEASRWASVAGIAQGSVSLLGTLIRDDIRGAGRDADQGEQDLLTGLGHVASQLEELQTNWSSVLMQAERDRAVLLEGRGGSGKSHLLADQARRGIAEGRPVVLVLGQHLRARAIWPQILERLGVLGTPPETFLQALDSAAEATSKRALFLVDALNEGAGAPLWKNELASFLETFKPFTNIACVLSCRSEYLTFVVPSRVAKNLVNVTVRGFVTAQEQREAASVYMDRNGIARPSSPWLAEEFRNPLFLRSVCIALHKDGVREFPRGLVGIKKILGLYLDSVARHLVPDYDGSNELVAPTRGAVLAIAQAMANARRDFVSRDAADTIARTRFASFQHPSGSTWLEELHRSGLLRFDPDPDLKPHDPLPENVSVVRFAFQRFQDHLIAEALLTQVEDIGHAFEPHGPLHFLIDHKQWWILGSGLVGALAIQMPELFGQELVDVMPGGLARWRGFKVLKPAFEDSLRLRVSDAFNSRTTELFEDWIADGRRAVSLLLELATVADHPWSAEGMHARLSAISMPERDLRWSLALNEVKQGDDRHAFYVLVEWCTTPEARSAGGRTRELAALALAWCLTCSNRPVRDAATKALSRLLLIQGGLLPHLVGKLKDVDDNYVLERLWAAAFGACGNDPSPERLRLYAQLAWQTVFSSSPRKDLLLRDYARAIIELAAHMAVKLEGDIDLLRCKPPYAEAGTDLTKVRELTRAAEQSMSRGAQRIVSSCLHMGDFGDYEIRPTVQEITTVSVAALPIATKESAFRNFRSTVLADRMDRVAAFHKLEEHLRMIHMPQMMEVESKLVFARKTPSKPEEAQAALLEKQLLALLSPDEVRRFREEAVPWLTDSHSEQAERVDLKRCQTWVAMRAIELAGSAIEADGPHSMSSRDRPIVERLSKKYQWLALSELLCGLGSTLCLESGWQGDRTLRPYDYPTDFGFVRDIDPTVLSHNPRSTAKAGDAWMFGDPITLDEVSEDDLSAWPFRGDPGKEFEKKVLRCEDGGRRWFVLYDHTHKTGRYLRKSNEHGMRQQEFRRIFSAFVETSRLEEFIEALKENQDIDVSNWEVPQLTDGPYLGEIFWRATAPKEQWSDRGVRVPPSIRLAYPVCQYVWESHLDLSLPDGAGAYLPASWLANKLNWTILPSASDTIVDSTGQGVFIRKSTDEDVVVLMSEGALERLRREAALSCVWLLVAERNAWPAGSNAAATWRRAEGAAWMDGSRVVSHTWMRDGSALEAANSSRTGPRKRGGK